MRMLKDDYADDSEMLGARLIPVPKASEALRYFSGYAENLQLRHKSLGLFLCPCGMSSFDSVEAFLKEALCAKMIPDKLDAIVMVSDDAESDARRAFADALMRDDNDNHVTVVYDDTCTSEDALIEQSGIGFKMINDDGDYVLRIRYDDSISALEEFREISITDAYASCILPYVVASENMRRLSDGVHVRGDIGYVSFIMRDTLSREEVESVCGIVDTMSLGLLRVDASIIPNHSMSINDAHRHARYACCFADNDVDVIERNIDIARKYDGVIRIWESRLSDAPLTIDCVSKRMRFRDDSGLLRARKVMQDIGDAVGASNAIRAYLVNHVPIEDLL